MANFQNIVMIVAIVILIISLLIIGVMIYKDKYKNLFPPVLPGVLSLDGFIQKMAQIAPIYQYLDHMAAVIPYHLLKLQWSEQQWAETVTSMGWYYRTS